MLPSCFPNDTVIMNFPIIDNKVVKYVILEDEICYDWDDYNVWGAVLYDIENKNITTTKYGHGTDMTVRNEAVELDAAINAGIVSESELIKILVNSLPISISNIIDTFAAAHTLENPLSIPVTVNRGRKFKGDGYLVYATREPVRYGLGAYHNEYHYRPVIFNPVDGSFNVINSFGYLKLDKSVTENTAETVYENLPKTINEVRHLAHAWAYKMSYSHCDYNNYTDLVNNLARKAVPTDVIDVVAKGVAAKIEAMNAEKEKKMMEKLPKIIEWVKNNTDKTTEEDILELAKHIYHKYN